MLLAYDWRPTDCSTQYFIRHSFLSHKYLTSAAATVHKATVTHIRHPLYTIIRNKIGHDMMHRCSILPNCAPIYHSTFQLDAQIKRNSSNKKVFQVNYVVAVQFSFIFSRRFFFFLMEWRRCFSVCLICHHMFCILLLFNKPREWCCNCFLLLLIVFF